MALKIGQTFKLGSGIRTGVAPGGSQYGVGAGGKVKILGTRNVGGQLYYNIQHIGGGTGWTPASSLQKSVTTAPAKKAPAKKAPAPKPVVAPPKTADEIIVERTEKLMEEYKKRAGEFDTTNPFAFDEELARQAALEEVSPFYNQQLSDFLQGIETQRGRSTEDERNLLADLKADTESYTGRAKLELDRAINASREGFADAGTFFSGRRLRQEGIIEEEEQFKTGEFLRGAGIQERGIRQTGARSLEDLALEQRLGQRGIERQRGLDVVESLEEARRRSGLQRSLEKIEFLGQAPGEDFASFLQRQSEAERALL